MNDWRNYKHQEIGGYYKKMMAAGKKAELPTPEEMMNCLLCKVDTPRMAAVFVLYIEIKSLVTLESKTTRKACRFQLSEHT